MTSAFAAYRHHVQPLATKASTWRILLTVVIVALGQVIASVVLFVAAAFLLVRLTGATENEVYEGLLTLQTPLALLLTLLTFMGFTGGVVLSMRFLHRASIRLLLGLSLRFDWRGFARAMLIFLAIGIAAILASLPVQAYRPNLAPDIWILWCVPALAALLVQVFAEELVFRGYLQAQLAARIASPMIWIGLPALVFGALHLPTALAFGTNAWLVLAAPTLLGLLAGHMTVHTGNIAAATGFHFANNLLGLLFVSIPGPFSNLSLLIYDIDLGDIATVRPMILVNLALIVLSYVIFLWCTPPHTQRVIATGPARD